MPRFPRDIDQERAALAFERLGGTRRLRSKRGHLVIKMPNGAIVSLPTGILKVGLLQSQVRRAELADDDFLNALGR
jgi:hypothetical protein